MGGRGTIKCDVLCLVMMQCDQYNEQLRLKIDRLDLRKHFDCQKMSSDQHIYYDILQDLMLLLRLLYDLDCNFNRAVERDSGNVTIH